jgi:uncharacterized surface protein with fasciclin (FAS1) repeats
MVALVALLVALFAALSVSAQAELTRVRIAHFSPDAPAVQIFINGQRSDIQTLRFGDVSGWVELLPGTYSIAVVPAGAGLDAAAIGPVNVSFAPGGWLTIAAIGSLNAGTLTVGTVNEAYRTLAADEARVTVFHAIEDAPAVDVILPDGTAIVSGLSFGQGAVLNVPAGTYSLSVVAAGTTGPAVLSLPNTALNARTFYFVAATNTLSNPQVALSVVGQSRVAPLIGKRNLPSIAAIVAGDSRFDTLEAAVNAAGLTGALRTGGPFTVFAPTDDAFAALLSALNVSAADLLADTALLTTVLQYHVVVGSAPASEVTRFTALPTLLPNSQILVEVRDGRVFLNDTVEVIVADIAASNGTIHVINAVLLPR